MRFRLWRGVFGRTGHSLSTDGGLVALAALGGPAVDASPQALAFAEPLAGGPDIPVADGHTSCYGAASARPLYGQEVGNWACFLLALEPRPEFVRGLDAAGDVTFGVCLMRGRRCGHVFETLQRYERRRGRVISLGA